MVRLVFRPYTQVRKAICTSAHLRASTRVSSGFALLRHSSPSFGSLGSRSTPGLRKTSSGVDGAGTGHPIDYFHCASWVCHPPTHVNLRLLGPCFKTGRLETFRQHPEDAVPNGLGRPWDLDRPGDITGVATPGFVPPGQPMLTSAQRIQPTARRACAWAHPRPPIASLSTISSTFNSLFKVLFIFPSRYLFAIGLPSVFSLRWDLPPALGCIPKQPDSSKASRGGPATGPNGVLTLSDAPFQGTWGRTGPESTSLDYNSPAGGWRFSSWALPGSLAVTRGILVSFFSSAY